VPGVEAGEQEGELNPGFGPEIVPDLVRAQRIFLRQSGHVGVARVTARQGLSSIEDRGGEVLEEGAHLADQLRGQGGRARAPAVEASLDHGEAALDEAAQSQGPGTGVARVGLVRAPGCMAKKRSSRRDSLRPSSECYCTVSFERGPPLLPA